MKITHLVLFVVLAATSPFIFISCKKDKTTTTNSSIIRFQLQTTNRTAVVSRTSSITTGNIVWISGSASSSEIKFEAKNGDHQVEYKSGTSQNIDLLSPLTTLGNITLPVGTYNQVQFKIELNPSGSNPTFQLNGEFTVAGTTIPVALVVTGPLEIKTEKDNVVIADNTNYKALTSIILSALTEGITESMLKNAVRTGSTIIISSSSNTNLYNLVITNFDDSDQVEFDHE